MIFDMSDAFDDLLQTITREQVTVTTVNFVPTETVVSTPIEAVVQPANLENLNKDTIDYSLEYLRVDSHSELNNKSRIVYKGKRFKWYQKGDYSDYGFYSAIFEESK